MNEVTLMGRLGSDPETRQSQSGMAVTKFSLATDRGYGEDKKTDWHKVVCFDKNAVNAERFLAKGCRVLVKGSIAYNQWKKDDGSTTYFTEIQAFSLEFIDWAEEQDSQQSGRQSQNQGQQRDNQRSGQGSQRGGNERGQRGGNERSQNTQRGGNERNTGRRPSRDEGFTDDDIPF